MKNGSIGYVSVIILATIGFLLLCNAYSIKTLLRTLSNNTCTTSNLYLQANLTTLFDLEYKKKLSTSNTQLELSKIFTDLTTFDTILKKAYPEIVNLGTTTITESITEGQYNPSFWILNTDQEKVTALTLARELTISKNSQFTDVLDPIIDITQLKNLKASINYTAYFKKIDFREFVLMCTGSTFTWNGQLSIDNNTDGLVYIKHPLTSLTTLGLNQGNRRFIITNEKNLDSKYDIYGLPEQPLKPTNADLSIDFVSSTPSIPIEYSDFIRVEDLTVGGVKQLRPVIYLGSMALSPYRSLKLNSDVDVVIIGDYMDNLRDSSISPVITTPVFAFGTDLNKSITIETAANIVLWGSLNTSKINLILHHLGNRLLFQPNNILSGPVSQQIYWSLYYTNYTNKDLYVGYTGSLVMPQNLNIHGGIYTSCNNLYIDSLNLHLIGGGYTNVSLPYYYVLIGSNLKSLVWTPIY